MSQTRFRERWAILSRWALVAALAVSAAADFRLGAQGSPSFVIRSSANPSFVTEPVTFTAIVADRHASGSVAFADGGSPLGTAALSPALDLLPPSAYRVAPEPIWVDAGDLDSDGLHDLVVTSDESATIAWLKGALGPSFEPPVNIASNVRGPVATGDFTGDGNRDLAVADWMSAEIRIFDGDGNGGFAAARTIAAEVMPMRYLKVADFDGNGIDDLLAVSHVDAGLICWNDIAGTTTSPIAIGDVVTLGDVNADGAIDILGVPPKTEGTTAPQVRTFLNTSVTGPPRGFAVGPVSAIPAARAVALLFEAAFPQPSGRLLVLDEGDEPAGPGVVWIHPGEGTGAFTAAPLSFNASTRPIAMAFSGSTLSTPHNLVVVSANSDVLVFRSLLDGRYEAPATYKVAGVPTAITAADFDKDGRIDVAISSHIGAEFGALNVMSGLESLENASIATITAPMTTPGEHVISATYGGVTAVVEQVVLTGMASIGLTVEPSAPAVPLGSSFDVTVQWTADSPPPTGDITIRDEGAVVATVPVGTGTSITVTLAAQGAYVHDLTATYSGDRHYNTESRNATVEVVRDSVSATLAVTPNPVRADQPATLSAVVAADNYRKDPPTGAVTLSNSLGVQLPPIALAPARGFLPPNNRIAFAQAAFRDFALADMDTDNVLDLVTIDGPQHISTFKGLGGGRFGARRSFLIGQQLTSLVMGDFQADGSANDIAVVDTATQAVLVAMSRDDGTLEPPFSTPVRVSLGIVAGEFNHDGLTDLIALSDVAYPDGAGSVDVLLALGDGHFAGASRLGLERTPLAIAAADLNEDGGTELVVLESPATAGEQARIGIRIVRPNGTLGPAAYHGTGVSSTTGLALVDLQEDGAALDVIAINNDATVSVIDPATGQVAQHRTASQSAFVAAADVDGDDLPDLITANADGTVGVLSQGAGGTLSTPFLHSSRSNNPISRLIVHDVDADSRIDVLVSPNALVLEFMPNGMVGRGVVTAGGLAAGPQTTTASFEGDLHFFPGSATAAHEVTHIPAVMTLSATPGAQAIARTPVTLTAAVDVPGEARVRFAATTAGTTTSLGEAPVSNGVAALTIDSLTMGAYELSATLLSPRHQAHAVIPYSITPVATMLTITGLPEPSLPHRDVTFAVNVISTRPSPSAPRPAGSVTLSTGSVTLGTINLVDGAGILSTRQLAIGTRTIRAQYVATDGIHEGSIKSITHQVADGPRCFFTSSPSPSANGEAVTFTATCTDPHSLGAADFFFKEGSTTHAHVRVEGPPELVRTASFTTSTLAPGNHELLVVASSASATLTHTVLADTRPIRVVSLADSGPGSLREAVTNAPSGSSISIEAVGTIVLSSPLVIREKELTITGPGRQLLRLDGGAAVRHFAVISAFRVPSYQVSISGMTLQNGRAHGGRGGNGYGGGGGGAGLGGSIFTDNVFLTVRDVAFVNNVARGGDGGRGYLYVDGTGGGGGGMDANHGGDGNPSGGGGGGGGGVMGGAPTFGGWALERGGNGGPGAGGGGGYAGGNLPNSGTGAGAGGFGGGGGGGFSGHGGFGGGGGGQGATAGGPGAGGLYAGSGGSQGLDACIVGGFFCEDDFYGGGGGGGAGLGGAIFANAGILSLIDTAFENNQAHGGVAGFFHNDVASFAVAPNAGQGKGGAIFAGEHAEIRMYGATALADNTASHAGIGTSCRGIGTTDSGSLCGVINTAPNEVIVPISGANQTAVLGTQFGSALRVRTFGNNGQPAANREVFFTLPTTGAGAAFAGETTTVSVMTDANGVATSPLFRANQTVGPFTALAWLGFQRAPFAMQNVVAAGATTVNVTATPPAGGAKYGSTIVITAHVTRSVAATPSLVEFLDDQQIIGTAPVVNGAATLTTTLLGSGARMLRAIYPGDAGNPRASGLTVLEVQSRPQSSFAGPRTWLDAPDVAAIAVGHLNGSATGVVVAHKNVGGIRVIADTAQGFGITAHYASPADTAGVALADFNHDGNVDILAAGRQAVVLHGVGSGTFAAGAPFDLVQPARSVAAGDFDADGYPDFAVGGDSQIAVWRGRGNGTFAAAATLEGSTGYRALVVGDFNHDTLADLAAACDGGIAVYAGAAGGTFAAPVFYAAGQTPAAMVVGDANGDGSLDLFVANRGGDAARQVSVLLANPDGTFKAATHYAAGGTTANAIAIEDLNGDGIGDLAVAVVGGPQGIRVFYGRGDGSFNDHVVYPLGHGAISRVAIADLNADGRADLLTTLSEMWEVAPLFGGAPGSPAITWTPADLRFGTPLGPEQLNASANRKGIFVYSLPLGTLFPQVGPITLNVTFYPADPAEAGVMTASAQINVTTPVTLSWAPPADIQYGTALGAAQLNAVASMPGNANVPGTYSYSPPPGMVLSAGVHTLTVRFSPADGMLTPTLMTTTQLRVIGQPARVTVGNVTRQYLSTERPPLSGHVNVTGRQFAIVAAPVGDSQWRSEFALNDRFVRLVFSTPATAASPRGIYPIVLESAEGGRDLEFQLDPATLTITRTLTITTVAHPPEIMYGQAPPTFAAVATGFIDGDTLASLNGALTFTGLGTAAGSYLVTPGGVSSTKYDITFVPAPFTVRKALLGVSIRSATRPYGSPNPEPQFDFAGFVNGDDAAAVQQVDYTIGADQTSPVGDYLVTVQSIVSHNYQLAMSTLSTLSVVPAALTVRAENATRGFGDANPVLRGTFEGVVNGDDALVYADGMNTPGVAAVFYVDPAVDAAAPQGTYPVHAKLIGPRSANYAPAIVEGTLTIGEPVDGQTWLVTTLDASGPGSLRQAIAESSAGDTIAFHAALAGGTILVSNDAGLGAIVIPSSRRIAGPGAKQMTISGGGRSRVFHIESGAAVSISGVTLTQGFGADGQGGAIHNAGSLSLRDVAITDSVSRGQDGEVPERLGSGGGGGGAGGAVFNAFGAALHIDRSTLSGNRAIGGGGGMQPNRTLSVGFGRSGPGGGGAGFGGAVLNDGGVVTIATSTLSGNQAMGGRPGGYSSFIGCCGGGGGNGYGSGGPGGDVHTRPTANGIAGNFGGGGGGGSYGATFAGIPNGPGGDGGFGGGAGAGHNSSGADGTPGFGGGAAGAGGEFRVAGPGGAFGGAIFSRNGIVHVTGSTIAQNVTVPGAPGDGTDATGGIFFSTPGPATAYGGGVFNYGASLTLRNTIVAGNSSTESITGGEIYNYLAAGGTLTSGGHNLIRCDGAATITAAAGDIIGASCGAMHVGLGELADNGGSTATHALLSGSPAIDAGDNGGAPSTDQRGGTRVDNGTIDIGAYEFSHRLSQTIEFGPLADKVFRDPPFDVSASASSGLDVSFAIVSGPATIAGGTITITGAGTVVVRASQSGDDTFAPASSDASFTVAKADAVITFSPPQTAYTFGAQPFELTARASSGASPSLMVLPPSNPGAIVECGPVAEFISASNIGTPGQVSATLRINCGGIATIRASAPATDNYNSAHADLVLTVAKAAQTITFDPLPDKTYGDAPFAVAATSSSDLWVLLTVDEGPATIDENNILTLTGAGRVSVRASVDESQNYERPADVVRTFTVAQATPIVTWPTPAAIIYGTQLDGTQLNATASVGGTFGYTPASGILDAGTHTLHVTFTPDDSTNYAVVAKTVDLEVLKATPSITWNDPGAIVYGTPLTATELNATADVDGTFTYAPVAGRILSAGDHHALTVTFTPADSGNYTTTTTTVTIDVRKALLTVTASGSRVYGSPNELIPSYTGFVNGETLATSGVTGAPGVLTSAGATSPAGIYPVMVGPGTLAAGNYTFAFANGTLTIVNPLPVIDHVAPNSIVKIAEPDVAASLTLEIHGDGFVPQSVARWDGDDLLTTFVSPQRLDAAVPPQRLSEVGVGYVTVANAADFGGGGTSGVEEIFITAAPAPVMAADTMTVDNGTGTLTIGGTGHETPGSLTAIATGTGTVTIAHYEANPGPAVQFKSAGTYFDAFVTDGSVLTVLTVVNCNLNGGNRVFWYDPAAATPGWFIVSPQTWSSDTGCITMTLDNVLSSPRIDQLDGTFFAVAVDAVAPVTSASATTGGRDYAFGSWTNEPVQVTLAAADHADGSGVAALVYAVAGSPQIDPDGVATFDVSTEGETTITFAAEDRAGNRETQQTRVVKIDRAAPVATAVPSTTTLWPPNGRLVPVTITGRINEEHSGVASAAYRVTDEYGETQPAGAIAVATDGRYTFTVMLPASRRDDDRNGRRYDIVVAVSDGARNESRVTAAVAVLHDQRK